MRIREVTEADVWFLDRMVLLAGFPPGRPLPSKASTMPHVRRFVEAWGRRGDVGLVALDAAQHPLGAAWARQLVDPLLVDHIGAPVAEVAIAVESHARGGGIGTALLRALEHAAAAAGHRELSLTVSPRNPAARLYARAGYELVGDRELMREREDGLVMRLGLR
jgi:GNAT superfamily N-acetyltransferase